MNSLSLVLQAGSIRLREELEAMLVIAALAALLGRANVAIELKTIYPGARPEAVHDDQSEAIAMLLASVLML
jgi:hypothetical protein